MSNTNLFNLSGKVAVITGAGSGLGRTLCETMAENGSDVVCADINEAWAKETAEMIKKHGGKALASKTDVSKQDDVKALFQEIDRTFGKLDILFNNAGISTKGMRIHEMPLEDWNKVISINLTGVFICMQEALKIMLRQKSGSIINISSVLGILGADPNILSNQHYIASKHGIIGLTKAAAAQYGPDNIRVNAVAPGFYAGTRLSDADERTEEESNALADKVCSLTPLGRFAQPEELKGLALLLASDASSFITGATYVTDGGWSIW